jgi:hypothetical protein
MRRRKQHPDPYHLGSIIEELHKELSSGSDHPWFVYINVKAETLRDMIDYMREVESYFASWVHRFGPDQRSVREHQEAIDAVRQKLGLIDPPRKATSDTVAIRETRHH